MCKGKATGGEGLNNYTLLTYGHLPGTGSKQEKGKDGSYTRHSLSAVFVPRQNVCMSCRD